MKNKSLQYILMLNLGMFCIATSGVLGRHIELAPPITIFFRAAFAIFFLGVFCAFKKYKFQFEAKKDGFTIAISGILMAIHWVTYFYALQWSNVAIAMLSLFTYPILTTLLEPIILQKNYEKRHVLMSLLILVGIYFLVPNFDIDNSSTKGLLMGLASALAYSIRNILLKTKIDSFNGSVLIFYQMIITMVLLIPSLFIFDFDSDHLIQQAPYLAFLGLITTAVGHTLFLNSFQHFSISTVSILSSMQPIYGILLAIVFIHELPSWSSVIGGVLILMTVVIESGWSGKN